MDEVRERRIQQHVYDEVRDLIVENGSTVGPLPECIEATLLVELQRRAVQELRREGHHLPESIADLSVRQRELIIQLYLIAEIRRRGEAEAQWTRQLGAVEQSLRELKEDLHSTVSARIRPGTPSGDAVAGAVDEVHRSVLEGAGIDPGQERESDV